MIKVKQFLKIKESNYGLPKLDEEINEWLEKNKNIEIIDIKYQTSIDNRGLTVVTVLASALIIYKEV